jgi:hypothetical protein
MRTRRRFQPWLDELSLRIAPSAVAVAPDAGNLPLPPPVMVAMDASTPPTDDGSPIVVAPPATNPPDPGLC